LANFLEELSFIFQRLNLGSMIDLLLVTLIFFGLLVILRNTQGMILLRGVFFLFVLVSLLTAMFDLPAFSWLVRNTVPVLLLAIPVIFAPEIRRALERLGRASSIIPTRGNFTETEEMITAVVHAAARLADRRHGALFVIQRTVGLDEFIATGVHIDAVLTPELLLQIFYPNTPLHDGAVIISGNRVLGAASVMPLSASGALMDSPENKIGLRHRAALGASEISDAVVLVVSEETGSISIANGGRMLQRLNIERVESILRTFFEPMEKRKGILGLVYRLLPFLESDRSVIGER
jgi:diadenylate cyclase